MSDHEKLPLLVGEIIVDVTITPAGLENKMRLGGIAHAARGFWALNRPFASAVVLPRYVEESAKKYFESLGCIEFRVLGYVDGAPNVTIIFDVTEVSHQGYESLLRDEKRIVLVETASPWNGPAFHDILVFPGSYDFGLVKQFISSGSRVHLDAAYDVEGIEQLSAFKGNLATVIISTSSPLFERNEHTGLGEVAEYFSKLGLEAIILKENRGGSSLHLYSENKDFRIPAQLGATVNSVGVGDVFDAVYVSYRERGAHEAALRASFASAAYAQTTEPDVFKNYVRRDMALKQDALVALGGTSLPWEVRQRTQIYLAAPDFKEAKREAIERALEALAYHNFRVRRPVLENGELPRDSSITTLRATYRKDLELLRECALIFAVPTDRDPGTLVEIGYAIAIGKPVVVFDPSRENANTMVIAGSDRYSSDLDDCLNATFELLAKVDSYHD